MTKKLTALLVLLLSISFGSKALAASILAICSKNSDLTDCPDSKLFFPVYRTTGGVTTFNYRIDQGPLGELSNEQTVSITEELLEKWANESSLDFVRTGTGFLDDDIDSSNYGPILEPSSPLGYSPVIWDAEGDIIEDVLGAGTREFVLGFAGATCYHSSNIGVSCAGVSGDVNRVVESQTMFNGYLFNGDNTGDSPSRVLSDFTTTLLHEFAHMFSIDHTQGGNLKGYNESTGDYEDIPTMFPVAANSLEDLQQDDKASVSQAYPKGDEATKYGTIKGQLLKSGSLIKGASIVAYKVGESNPRKLAVAAPSDSDGRDNFVIPGLLPGTYVLFAEPIDSSFQGGSSIGLHDPISPSKMTSGFYNGDNAAIIKSTNLNTGIASGEQITVNAGDLIEVVFDTAATGTGSGGGDNGGGSNGEEASFIAGGRAFNGKTINTKLNKTKKVKAKIVNQTPGELREISFSTDNPELIQFVPETISFSKRSKKIKVIIASYLDIVDVFPEFETDSIEIPVTITDSTTDYTDNGNSLVLF